MSEAAEAQMPVFPDLESGQAYLSSLMLANPLAAEQQLTLFLESLLAEPPDPGILLQLLEQARAPLCFVEEEMARRYQNKPVRDIATVAFEAGVISLSDYEIVKHRNRLRDVVVHVDDFPFDYGVATAHKPAGDRM